MGKPPQVVRYGPPVIEPDETITRLPPEPGLPGTVPPEEDASEDRRVRRDRKYRTRPTERVYLGGDRVWIDHLEPLSHGGTVVSWLEEEQGYSILRDTGDLCVFGSVSLIPWPEIGPGDRFWDRALSYALGTSEPLRRVLLEVLWWSERTSDFLRSLLEESQRDVAGGG